MADDKTNADETCGRCGYTKGEHAKFPELGGAAICPTSIFEKEQSGVVEGPSVATDDPLEAATCQACGNPLPMDIPPIAGFVICGRCLRTVSLSTGEPATADDTLRMKPNQLADLKERRKLARKALGQV